MVASAKVETAKASGTNASVRIKGSVRKPKTEEQKKEAERIKAMKA